MEDIIWKTKHRFKSLQSYIDGLQGTWSDQAQRELYTHYLAPHQEESVQAIASLEEQNTVLEKIEMKLEEVENCIAQAYTSGEHVNKHLTDVESAMNDCWRCHEQYLHYEHTAQTQLSPIQELIERAKACIEQV